MSFVSCSTASAPTSITYINYNLTVPLDGTTYEFQNRDIAGVDELKCNKINATTYAIGETVSFKDLIIETNSDKKDLTSYSNKTGVLFNRATGLTGYQVEFDESDDSIRVGASGSTQHVLTRPASASMTAGRPIRWNGSSLYAETIDYDLSVTGTSSINQDVTTSGAVVHKSLTLTDTGGSVGFSVSSDGDLNIGPVPGGSVNMLFNASDTNDFLRLKRGGAGSEKTYMMLSPYDGVNARFALGPLDIIGGEWTVTETNSVSLLCNDIYGASIYNKLSANIGSITMPVIAGFTDTNGFRLYCPTDATKYAQTKVDSSGNLEIIPVGTNTDLHGVLYSRAKSTPTVDYTTISTDTNGLRIDPASGKIYADCEEIILSATSTTPQHGIYFNSINHGIYREAAGNNLHIVTTAGNIELTPTSGGVKINGDGWLELVDTSGSAMGFLHRCGTDPQFYNAWFRGTTPVGYMGFTHATDGTGLLAATPTYPGCMQLGTSQALAVELIAQNVIKQILTSNETRNVGSVWFQAAENSTTAYAKIDATNYLQIDTINELTSTAGVDIDNVLHKDGTVRIKSGTDTSTLSITTWGSLVQLQSSTAFTCSEDFHVREAGTSDNFAWMRYANDHAVLAGWNGSVVVGVEIGEKGVGGSTLYVDSIAELNSASGVTAGGVLLKNSTAIISTVDDATKYVTLGHTTAGGLTISGTQKKITLGTDHEVIFTDGTHTSSLKIGTVTAASQYPLTCSSAFNCAEELHINDAVTAGAYTWIKYNHSTDRAGVGGWTSSTISGLEIGDASSVSQLFVNQIDELTAASGVTIDGCLLKDTALYTDTIDEKTAHHGVSIPSTITDVEEIRMKMFDSGFYWSKLTSEVKLLDDNTDGTFFNILLPSEVCVLAGRLDIIAYIADHQCTMASYNFSVCRKLNTAANIAISSALGAVNSTVGSETITLTPSIIVNSGAATENQSIYFNCKGDTSSSSQVSVRMLIEYHCTEFSSPLTGRVMVYQPDPES